MINKKKIIAIVPLKKNSVRLKKKNLKLFNNKPLFLWTLLEAKKSKYIDKIIVTTDSHEAVSISKKNKVLAPFIRPKKLCLKMSSSEDVIIHTLQYLKKNKLKYDYFILLQPTSPLRDFYVIDKSIELIPKHKEIDNFISYTKNKNKIANGLIYISKINNFLKSKNFYIKNKFFHTESKISDDIDNYKQFIKAEKKHIKERYKLVDNTFSKTQVIKFLSKINESAFIDSNKISKGPWKFVNDKRFKFLFIKNKNTILGSMVILSTNLVNHIIFLYILNEYRNKMFGTIFLEYYKKNFKKKYTTVHIDNTLKQTLEFYKKFSFVKAHQNNYNNPILINKWINRCLKYNNKTYEKRKLLYMEKK